MAILQNRRERALRRERGIDASYVANGACLAWSLTLWPNWRRDLRRQLVWRF